MTDYQLEALKKNNIGWWGRFLCSIGIHKYDEVYCVRCEHRMNTLE